MKRPITSFLVILALILLSILDVYRPGFCAAYPQRIVSLCPSITEQLYLLEIQDRLIACTIYCNQPREAKNKEKIGNVIDINVEKIVSLTPDLVIATPLANAKAVEKLKGLGIPVITFSSPESFNELCNQYRALAEIVGRQDSARKLITQAKNKVSVLNNKVKSFAQPKVFVQVGANPLVTVTRKSFIHDCITIAGGENIASSDITSLYSREDVLKKNPDVILIVTMGIAGEKEREVWRTYRAINAVKNNRIHVVDSDKICSPTPVSFIETLEELITILHPELTAAEEER